MQRKTSVSDVRHVSSGKAGGPVGAALGQVVLMVLALSLALGVAGCGANVGDLTPLRWSMMLGASWTSTAYG